MALPIEVINAGWYIPTTFIFDIELLSKQDGKSVDPEIFKELLIQLYQIVNNVALQSNAKTTGYYLLNEFNTGQQLFSTSNDFNNLRNMFRVVVNFGALPAAGSKSVAHGIQNMTANYSFVKIYGAATNPVALTYIPLPFSSSTAVASNLQITVDATNVTITTGGTNYSAYTVSYVVLEYVKF